MFVLVMSEDNVLHSSKGLVLCCFLSQMHTNVNRVRMNWHFRNILLHLKFCSFFLAFKTNMSALFSKQL